MATGIWKSFELEIERINESRLDQIWGSLDHISQPIFFPSARFALLKFHSHKQSSEKNPVLCIPALFSSYRKIKASKYEPEKTQNFKSIREDLLKTIRTF